jgi:predicted DCC family thiol-disulfide oxidoreductase YuxK
MEGQEIMNTGTTALLTAYYDGQCGLCRAEMGEIRAMDEQGDIELVDCSAPDFADEAVHRAGFTRADLMGALHVRDVLGDWHRGVDAIALLYATVGAPWLAHAWAHPLTRPITRRLYPWVVAHRHTLSRLGLDMVAPRVLHLFARRHQQRHVPHCVHGSCRLDSPGPRASGGAIH